MNLTNINVWIRLSKMIALLNNAYFWKFKLLSLPCMLSTFIESETDHSSKNGLIYKSNMLFSNAYKL